jgi:hypothetical protein
MKKNDALQWNSVEKYLKSIRMFANVDVKRVKELFNTGKILCPEDLRDIFISNYKENDGKDQFKDFWLFSDNYVIEVQNLITETMPELDMTIISKNIQNVSIKVDNFDLSQKATDVSKIRMEFYTYSDFSVDQIATGSNCDKVMYIFNTYVKHNLARGQSSLNQI